MKVLFAVNNEKVSESIMKNYQARYKEIISAKNVYYFNAIIKELQKDKSYDRVVISEDLEPYSNKNYEMIDKFIFEKMDSISDEASNSTEGEIPIIFICSDRREKGEQILLKLFSIGVYSALLGNDRTIDNVCSLINKPRTKKEAKVYYRIESDSADYRSERTEDVNEAEIQNIVNYFKKIGKNETKCIESYNSIASQYTTEQLKIIVGFLPLMSRAILEEKCPKYQELMVGSVKSKIKTAQGNITTKDIKSKPTVYNPNNANKINLIEEQLNRSKLRKPVVIPSTVSSDKVRRLYKEDENQEIEKMPNTISAKKEDATEKIENNVVEPVKRGRGRPPKNKIVEEVESIEPVKRGRGRPPKKVQVETETVVNSQPAEDVNLFGLADDTNQEVEKIAPKRPANNYTQQEELGVLPGIYDDDDDETSSVLPGLYDEPAEDTLSGDYNNLENRTSTVPERKVEYGDLPESYNNTNMQRETDLSNLLTSDKKIVAFVGTSKNGTSFLVNNLAIMLSSKGINTAILDLTKNKNAYYIYTQNDENLRNISYNCVENLRRGIAKGIPINKNLSVYTTSPTEEVRFDDYGNILETLVKNHSLVLLDCDFDTDYNYFKESQEIYVVQTYDILTIQPLTAFLRELKDRNILEQNKLKIVINKALKVRGLTEKMIVGGISSYNDPNMSYMKELFDKDTVTYVTVPFEEQTYSKYLEGLMMCEISLNGYSKGLLESLQKLGNMVYPLISSNRQQNPPKNYNNYEKRNTTSQFGRNIDDTLNKMRRNY